MNVNQKKQNIMKTNYEIWVEYLKKYNCYSESLINEYGEKIKKCSFNMNETNGGCYEGALAETIIYHLCKTAYNINETMKNTCPIMAVDTSSLIRVLLLQHIAKADYYIETPEQWKRNKGMLYDFNGEIKTQLKCGERSAWICMNHGIKLTDVEYEAMTIIDKDEKNTNCKMTPLCVMVKTVNQMVSVELQQIRNKMLNNSK